MMLSPELKGDHIAAQQLQKLVESPVLGLEKSKLF